MTDHRDDLNFNGVRVLAQCFQNQRAGLATAVAHQVKGKDPNDRDV